MVMNIPSNVHGHQIYGHTSTAERAAAVQVVHVTPVELCGLLHHVQTSLLHLRGCRLLLSIVRRQFGHHALKIIVAPLPDNTTVEDRRRFYIERQDLGSHDVRWFY